MAPAFAMLGRKVSAQVAGKGKKKSLSVFNEGLYGSEGCFDLEKEAGLYVSHVS